MLERRKFERTVTSIRVEMRHETIGVVIGYTQDISDGGARVVVENRIPFPKGTELMVRFHKVFGPVNEEPVPMKVMHADANSMGLMFAPR